MKEEDILKAARGKKDTVTQGGKDQNDSRLLDRNHVGLERMEQCIQRAETENGQIRTLYPTKVSLKIYDKTKTFIHKQKLR